ncbi:SH3 domain-containing protein [Rhizobium sp. AQ_MP]|uniref:SH3 domain-containing protein n=1 Tax=Rhizobium sp. AQ_MP TaxID=2761536 RepID=UPI00163AB000|nr:SH3 domain-containing protein [Rhizobium sp. AQ_MP]MBC2775112.1 SH3 domain-containing protein [Rhizobium sp. AQ_MP]
MRYALILSTAIAGVAILGSAAAQAGTYAAAEINMRAGPSTRYPSIGILPEGIPLNVFGCTNGYRWCDVEVSGRRGWVSAAYIDIDYDSQRVRIPAYAHLVQDPSLPTVSFSINSYWSHYYSDQDFYDQIETWDDIDWEDDAPPPGWMPGW